MLQGKSRKICIFLLFTCILPAVKNGFAQNKNYSLNTILKLADSIKYNAPDAAIKYAMKGLEMANKASDKKNSALAYSLLGTIKYIQVDYNESLKYHLEALKINEILNDKFAIGKNYNNIAMVLDDAGKDSSALSYYLKSIQIYESINEEKELIKLYNNLGAFYDNSNLRKKAIYYFEKAAKLAHETGQLVMEGSIKNNLAMIYITESKYSKGLDLLMQSLKAHQKTNNDRGAATNFLYLAETYFRLKDPEKGLNYMDSALTLAKEKGFKDILSEGYLKLAKFYEKNNNLAQALNNFKLRAEVEKDIINKASVSSMAEMQTKYETEKKEKENAILIQENKIKTLELSDQENKRNIMIGSFAFVLLLGGVSYNRYRLKQKNKILMERELRAHAVFQAQEDEKTRISKELHDGVGPLLSLIKLNVSSIEVNPKNEKIIKSTKELASKSIKEVRNISHSLMPGLLIKSGLRSALKELVEQMNASETINVEIGYKLAIKITPEAEVNMYRIIQEALNNILKHSGANQATIELSDQEKNIELKITDNGRGFDTEKLSSLSGNGLNNIYSRVDLLKSKITITSKKNQGTEISIHIPLHQIYNG